MTGISAGTVSIKGTSESGDSKECSITLESDKSANQNGNDASRHTQTKLKDKNGNQIYIFFCQAVNEVEAVEEASMAVSLVS